MLFHSKSHINKLLQLLIKNEKYKKVHLNFTNIFTTKHLGRPVRILGIETSCDDTGIAIVDGTGKILGEALDCQRSIHLKNGGILPPLARDLHIQNIESVCEQALAAAAMKLEDVDAIATTVKPGLPLSLHVGRRFGQKLALEANKPFIPIHHMEAHALTARMAEKIEYPFLVLLISGGHCLVALVENVSNFYRFGSTIDDAPGEAFDKTARSLRMINIPEYQDKHGGQAIELAASKATNPLQFEFPVAMRHERSCNFSFSGLKTSAKTHIARHERTFNVPDDDIIPDIENFCGSFQWAVARHLANKTKRAMLYCDSKNLLPSDKRILVISGGVACNNFIAKTIEMTCNEMNFRFVRPPPRLCTDNGIMIAWNGVERWHEDVGVLRDPAEIEKVDSDGKALLGEDWYEKILFADIQCKAMKSKERFPELFT